MKKPKTKTPNIDKEEKVKANITEFCLLAAESIEKGQGMEFLKDFTDTLYTKKKIKNTCAANYAYSLLKKARLIKDNNK